MIQTFKWGDCNKKQSGTLMYSFRIINMIMLVIVIASSKMIIIMLLDATWLHQASACNKSFKKQHLTKWCILSASCVFYLGYWSPHRTHAHLKMELAWLVYKYCSLILVIFYFCWSNMSGLQVPTAVYFCEISGFWSIEEQSVSPQRYTVYFMIEIMLTVYADNAYHKKKHFWFMICNFT